MAEVNKKPSRAKTDETESLENVPEEDIEIDFKFESQQSEGGLTDGFRDVHRLSIDDRNEIGFRERLRNRGPVNAGINTLRLIARLTARGG